MSSSWNPPRDGGFPGDPRPARGGYPPRSSLPPGSGSPGAPPPAGAGPLGDPIRTPSPEELARDSRYGQRSRVYVDPSLAFRPDFADIWRDGSVNCLANSRNVLCSYTPQPRSVFWLREWGQEAPCGAFTEVTWQIFIGDRAYMTFAPIAQVATFDRRMELKTPILGGLTVSIVAFTGANARTLAACIKGDEVGADLLVPERF